MAEAYEMIYGEVRVNDKFNQTIGFDSEKIDYVSTMCDKLFDALEKYKREGNRRWIEKTNAKLQYYLEKRKYLTNRKERGSVSGSGRPCAWNDEKDQFLKDNIGKMSNEEIGRHLCISATSVSNRRAKLGLSVKWNKNK